jgi:hypothetical protein
MPWESLPAAARKMTGAAAPAAGRPDALGHFLEVRFAPARRPQGLLGIGPGGIVTDQAVNVLLRREVEGLVLPAITDVATRALGDVGCRRDTKIVDDVLLAQSLAGLGADEVPRPVLGGVDLLGRLGVAGEAGPGDLGTRGEFPVQGLELAVVGRGSTRPGQGRGRCRKDNGNGDRGRGLEALNKDGHIDPPQVGESAVYDYIIF